MKEPTALQRLDNLMARLVEADQTGAGADPLRLAQELGQIRALFARAPAVRRAPGGQLHFRCESCGTISHGASRPERCPECGSDQLHHVDLEQPDVASGAG
jgi:rubrerythrin